MGITNAQAAKRGMLAVALMATVALLIMLAAMAVSASIGTQDAQALPSFNTAGAGLGPCDSCHSKDAIHAGATHSQQSCGKCHTVDTGTPPLPSACASCHGKAAILASAKHTSIGCGTAGGCHAAPTPTPSPSATVVTTTMALKVAPTTVTHGKKVKVTGTAGPAASLASAKVALKVERKVGTKWVKMKTGSATASATGAFTWSYKTAKKGAHRVTASIAKSTTHTAKKVVKAFKVK